MISSSVDSSESTKSAQIVPRAFLRFTLCLNPEWEKLNEFGLLELSYGSYEPGPTFCLTVLVFRKVCSYCCFYQLSTLRTVWVVLGSYVPGPIKDCSSDFSFRLLSSFSQRTCFWALTIEFWGGGLIATVPMLGSPSRLTFYSYAAGPGLTSSFWKPRPYRFEGCTA